MENTSKANPKSDWAKKILQLILFLGIGIFFIWLSMRPLMKDPEALQMLKDSIRSINNPRSWTFLVLSILCGAISHYIRAIRNTLLLEPLGYNVRKSMAFYSVMVCYISNLAVPRIGEVLRCTFLQRYEKVPFQKSLGTVVAERALDMVVWLGLFVIVIILNTSLLSNLIVDKENGISMGMWIENKAASMLTNYVLYIVAAAVIALIAMIYFTRKSWMKVPLFVKIKNIVVGIWQGLISIKDVKRPVAFVLYTILLWVFYFLGTYICFFAFDYLVDLGPVPAFVVLIFGTLGFMIAQGGLGAYPLIVAGILVLYGVEYGQGLAAGWIGWGVQTVMVIIFGIASLVLASFSNRKEKIE